jgi:hypothetical protein
VDYSTKKYKADPGNDPHEWETERFVADAHANRKGEEYPTPERLLENLPVILRGLCDYSLSGQATARWTSLELWRRSLMWSTAYRSISQLGIESFDCTGFWAAMADH